MRVLRSRLSRLVADRSLSAADVEAEMSLTCRDLPGGCRAAVGDVRAVCAVRAAQSIHQSATGEAVMLPARTLVQCPAPLPRALA
jgi:hypothetical protein